MKLLYTAISILIFSTTFSNAQVKIIFDTDIGGDADDLATMAMLHTFIDKGECDLLGIACWSTEEFAVPTLDALNRYYGHPDIPIGCRKGATHRNPENYGRPIAEKFEYTLTAEDAPDATELYRQILSEALDNSITILAVGPLYNIKALIESSADNISGLTGAELINQKVKEFVIMGGQFPEGKNEWNFNGNMPGVTKFVLENISRPITFSGFEIGAKIKTGAVLNERDKNTPLYIGFKYFSEHASWMKDQYKGIVSDNSSFDQTALLYAVRNGEGEYWTKISDGYCEADDKGGNKWIEKKAGKEHSYLKLAISPEGMAALIESLMLNEW